MIKHILAAIFMALPSLCLSLDSYNPNTGILYISHINVAGKNYEVFMQHNNQYFKVTSATPTSTLPSSANSYNSQNGTAYFSSIDVNGEKYQVSMQHQGDLQFEVTSVKPANNSVYPTVDTGQSYCYDSSGTQVNCLDSGQDATYTQNPPNYTNNSDGTIIDNVTGLMWQQSPDTNGDKQVDSTDKLTQYQAELYCSNLTLANHSDWRLPDIKTMYSLIDFSGEDVSSYTGSDTNGLNPFINNNYFDFVYGDTSAGERIIDVQYATSTLYVSTTMNGDKTMFGVNMADGRIKGYGITPRNSEKTFTVQCVRRNDSYANNSFTDNNDETITDTATDLMWQKSDSSTTKEWDEAISYCEKDTTASYHDWRLPNAKELQSIVDYSRSPDTTNSAAISAIFNATSMINEAGEKDWGAYWSSTTHKNSSGVQNSAVYINFGRALGYMNNQWMDVHGAGAQRSDPKSSSINLDRSFQTVADKNGESAIIHGPQGDVVRINNYVRCVR
ncbi:MAG: DUF1566 domain-containing protein [gamma proteobacterium symbiont of Taylorina sp.]|nr:DUF1566 domain-containing protein [gamma proteobacterium symbiont of Taylorina sp.]